MDDKALIILAEMLNKALIQANDIEATAPQFGVYGHIAAALHQTLILRTDARTAALIYQAILEGCSVKEAFALVTKSEVN